MTTYLRAIISLGLATAFAAVPQRSPDTIPAGVPLKVRLNPTLSTNSSPVGSTFTATLMEPLRTGGHVLAPRGAQVEGRVIHSDRGGRVKGRAVLALRLPRIYDADHRSHNLLTSSIWR